MMIRLSQSAVVLGVCVLVSVLTKVKSRQLPSFLDHLHTRLKKSDADKKSFRVAVRSFLDNRIDTIPPDPDYFTYHHRQAEPPYAMPYRPAPSRKHLSKARHWQPDVTPHFDLVFPEDLLMQEPPPVLPPKQLVPSLFEKSNIKNSRPNPSKQDFTKPEKLPNPLDLTFLSKNLPPPSKPLQSQKTADGGSENDKKGTKSVEGYPPLDPFFLSGIDLDDVPEDDASLGDAALSGLFGAAFPPDDTLNGDIPGHSDVDEATDNIMDEFLTFLELRDSGALNECLKKHSEAN